MPAARGQLGGESEAADASGAQVSRVFLDWDAPCLEAAADWLAAAPSSQDLHGLGRTMCVVPGKRAGRSLLAILLDRAARLDSDGRGGGGAMVPPRIATPSVMVDLLTIHASRDLATEPIIVASAVETKFIWMDVLRAAGDSERGTLIPHPPREDDLNAWLALAEMIHRARSDLAGERMTFADAVAATERMQRDREADRWRCLVALERQYRSRLRDYDLTDAHDARERRLNERVPATDFDRIVLIGAADLNRLQRDALGAAGVPITSLIHAPADRADDFDDFGCPLVASWREAWIDIDETRHALTIADRPADVAQAAMHAIAAQEEDREAADITIGLPDESLAGPLTTAATWAGLTLHNAAGTPLKRTPPARLLEAIADWLEDHRFTHFVTLLRTPEVEHAVERSDPTLKGKQHWLTLLDDYFNDHLQTRLTGIWLGKPERAEPLKRVWNAVNNLFSPLDGPPRPFHIWAQPILNVLTTLHDPEHSSRALREQLETVADSITAAMREPPGDLIPPLAAHAAIRLLLRLIGENAIAQSPRRDSIEMLGWLELHLDPAPMLVLTGVNDGSLPQSVRGDALLPDSLRQALGLLDNQRKYARDAYLLTAILHSRETVTLIAGRRGNEGDPLTPSRLLFACEDETLIHRVKLLCDDDHRESPGHPIGLPAPLEKSLFAIPSLPADLVIPDTLRVTAFRDYLACAYRFALKHLCGLERHGFGAAELDPLAFGSLAHKVLEVFGNDTEMREAHDEQRIRGFLFAALDDLARQRFGDSPPAAVRIQLARLEARLRDFAPVQAQMHRDGWRIIHIEHKLENGVPLDISGQSPMTITATIDRIDRHEGTGAYRIIDYKTSESGASPMKAHHGRETYDGEWIDLQLPLYDYIARRGVIPADAAEVELGYIVLPKQTDGVAFKAATWSREEIDAGVEKARDVVRNIRDGEFAPSSEFPSRFDPFARITQSTTFSALMEADDEGAGE